MIVFPIGDLLDEQACYDFLLKHLHPEGLKCPQGHPLLPGAGAYDRKDAPIIDYRCKQCGRIFNLFTGTLWKGTRYSCSEIVQIIRAVAQGTPTMHLARELKRDRGCLLNRRHQIQEFLQKARPQTPLPDRVTEADEMYQNAVEKGVQHPDPDDPPRRRANKVRGHGTWDNDRPPILGIVGRTSSEARLQVLHNSGKDDILPEVLRTTLPGVTVNTDEWKAYPSLPQHGRTHKTVCHKQHERTWARDEDGDGVREVHNNTLEGLWTGLRNFLRPFRGVNKEYLSQYVAVFEWAHRLKEAVGEFVSLLLGVRPQPMLDNS